MGAKSNAEMQNILSVGWTTKQRGDLAADDETYSHIVILMKQFFGLEGSNDN